MALAEQELAKSGSSEISIFQGKQATESQISISIAKLATAFPDMSKDFFNLLAERLMRSQMSAKRLDYALCEVLDNFRYKKLSIADVMSIDIKCKILTYSEMLVIINKNGESMSNFTPIWFGNSAKPHWVLKADKERYNLPERL